MQVTISKKISQSEVILKFSKSETEYNEVRVRVFSEELMKRINDIRMKDGKC